MIFKNKKVKEQFHETAFWFVGESLFFKSNFFFYTAQVFCECRSDLRVFVGKRDVPFVSFSGLQQEKVCQLIKHIQLTHHAVDKIS